jgi:hypothetical protein
MVSVEGIVPRAQDFGATFNVHGLPVQSHLMIRDWLVAMHNYSRFRSRNSDDFANSTFLSVAIRYNVNHVSLDFA